VAWEGRTSDRMLVPQVRPRCRPSRTQQSY